MLLQLESVACADFRDSEIPRWNVMETKGRVVISVL